MTRKTFCYSRVSTARQDGDSQFQQMLAYVETNKLSPPIWHGDVETGGRPWQERELAQILKTAKKGDVLLITEISRIERTLHGVLQFVYEAQKLGLEIHVIKSKLMLDNSLQSKITVSMLALAGEIERDLNNARSRAGVETRRARGLPLGRPHGTKIKLKLDKFREEIPKWRAKRLSMNAIAKLTDSSVPTVARWLAREAERQQKNKLPTLIA